MWAPLAQVGSDFIRDRSSGNENCIQQNKLCPGWAIDHIDRYTGPAVEHIVLVVISVTLGFVIAMGLALLSHRHRWLVPPITGLTGALYTVPSIAFFFLLLPITGRGGDTAVIALTAYTLQIIYRNIVIGLANVPEEAKESGRGMGMTDRQLLRQVELPLAVPEIIAGLRIATVSTVALATLAVFAGGGGLGSQIIAGSNITFKTGIVVAGGIAILIAISFDALLILAQRVLSPWRKVRPV
ncbi:MAG: ABC transporter permease [Solirubrobacterales bacterium]